jgi:hypothetical protein
MNPREKRSGWKLSSCGAERVNKRLSPPATQASRYDDFYDDFFARLLSTDWTDGLIGLSVR